MTEDGPMIRYKVSTWGYAIDRVTILKETDHYVTIPTRGYISGNTRRESNENYFATFEEARQRILKRATGKRDAAEADLRCARGAIEELMNMTEDQCAEES